MSDSVCGRSVLVEAVGWVLVGFFWGRGYAQEQGGAGRLNMIGLCRESTGAYVT